MEEKVVRYIHDILASPDMPESSGESGDIPEELAKVEGLEDLQKLCWEIRRVSSELAQGQLDFQCQEKGIVMGNFKALQSHLRHLTWQTQRIADGDYTHRVNFLGDFSEAFNKMTEQLSRQIEDLKTLSEEYKELSHKDQLTGLYNRNAFIQYGGAIASHLPKGGTQSSLVMIDIDHFKQVNDQHGHLGGDAVLVGFARTLTDAIRPGDLACRYGGEEFLVLLPDTPLKPALIVAERLRSKTEKMVVKHEGMWLQVTASFGVSEIYSKDNEYHAPDYLSAIQRADANLYRAKARGRNQIAYDGDEDEIE